MPAAPGTATHYAFGPQIRLAVRGSRSARAHFEREYGPAVPPRGSAAVVAAVGSWRPGAADGARGGHKTARWRVTLGPPDARPLRVAVTLAGGPPSFALSLVQGYYVEPLIALALAEAGYVALPSAAIAGERGALVIMGRSGTGKSSVSVRALAEGRRVLGDDQVIVAADGRCWRYPRRMRLYPDIEDTAPQAWPRLRPATRRTLRVRRVVRRATRGFVAPSLAVPVSELGAATDPGPVPAVRLVVVERSDAVRVLSERERDPGWAATRAAEVIAAQRSRFGAAAGDRWHSALQAAAAREAEVLRRWLGGLEIAELRIPRAWTAPAAVDALAERLEH
jgi:hypothetical protein